MTSIEMYDAARGISRNASGIAAEISPVDSWWNEGIDPMPIYKIGNELYCCEGWNGETYKAFRVLDRFTADESNPSTVTLRPIYRFEDEDREFDEEDETSGEVIGFEIEA